MTHPSNFSYVWHYTSQVSKKGCRRLVALWASGDGRRLILNDEADARLIGYVSPEKGYCKAKAQINWYQSAAKSNLYKQGPIIGYETMLKSGFLYAWEMPASAKGLGPPDSSCKTLFADLL
ncbi:unnamed protein product, partial [Mesorhabditis spiculigera]